MQNDIKKFNGFVKPPKKGVMKNKLVVFFLFLSFICISLGILIISNVIILSKYRPNKVINNFYFYVPNDWKSPQYNFFISPTGKCSLQVMALDASKYKKMKGKYESDLNDNFKEKEFNKREWQYLKVNYSESGEKAVYLINDDIYGSYSVLFIKTSDVDKNCNNYLNDLEHSLLLKKNRQK